MTIVRDAVVIFFKGESSAETIPRLHSLQEHKEDSHLIWINQVKPTMVSLVFSTKIIWDTTVYNSAINATTRADCLSGLLRKTKLTAATIDFIERQYYTSDNTLKELSLFILTKVNYKKAKPYLIEFADTNLLPIFQSIHWYAKDKNLEWLQLIEAKINKIDSDEAFRFCTYLLTEMRIDYAYLIIPFTTSPDKSIRVTAFHTLGKLPNKAKYVDTFITGLI